MFFWPYFTLPFLLKQCIFTFYFAEWYSVSFIAYICFWPLQDKPLPGPIICLALLAWEWRRNTHLMKNHPMTNKHLLGWGWFVGWTVFLQPGSSMAQGWWGLQTVGMGQNCPHAAVVLGGLWLGREQAAAHCCCPGNMSWRASATSDVLSSQCDE